jgi:hypothetical protein
MGQSVSAGHSPLTLWAVLLMLVSVGTPTAAAGAAECECRHLDALQAELRNARRLQQAFDNQSRALRSMGVLASVAALQRFAATSAREGLVRVPGYTGPAEVEYVPQGQNVHEDAIGRLGTEKLCALSQGSARALGQARAGSPCDGIASALQAHEDHHHRFCLRLGYPAYRAMHGADRATEEAESYGIQIGVLRSEIANMLARANVRVIVKTRMRSEMPKNPVYSALVVENYAEVLAKSAAASGPMIRLECDGKQTTTAAVEGGNCRMVGVPFSIPARAKVETDGLDAQIDYAPDSMIPSFGIQCRIPGQGSGSGMTIPTPSRPGDFRQAARLPLRDGAEMMIDIATTEAARIAARAGVRMTGQSSVRLVCPPKK